MTEGIIAAAAEMRASSFASSPARHLIDTNIVNVQKLRTIYKDAASMAYMLWTRKTAMKVFTLADMGRLTFDSEDPRLKPHSLVHPDDHEDKLRGRQITLIVHPLLQVCGTDEGRDYDNVRVWAPAEVWFKTK